MLRRGWGNMLGGRGQNWRAPMNPDCSCIQTGDMNQMSPWSQSPNMNQVSPWNQMPDMSQVSPWSQMSDMPQEAPWNQSSNQDPSWVQGIATQQDQTQANAQMLPDQVLPTEVSNPRIMPTRQFVQQRISNEVVPHVHPSHLTTINRHYIHNQYYFPHTESELNQVCETHTMCGQPFNPCRQSNW